MNGCTHFVLCCKSDFFDLVTFKYLRDNNYCGCANIHDGITNFLGKSYTLKVLSNSMNMVSTLTYRAIKWGIQTPRLSGDFSNENALQFHTYRMIFLRVSFSPLKVLSNHFRFDFLSCFFSCPRFFSNESISIGYS